jgi:hypothetical protein
MATAATTALAEWAAAEQVRTHTPRQHSVDAPATGLRLHSPATARMLLARMLPRWPTLAEMPGRPSEGKAHPEHRARITSASQTHESEFRSISEMSDEIVALRAQLATMRAAVQQVSEDRELDRSEMMDQVEHVKASLHARLAWARRQYEQKLHSQRGALQSQVWNQYALLERDARGKDQQVLEMRRALDDARAEVEDAEHRTHLMELLKTREVQVGRVTGEREGV